MIIVTHCGWVNFLMFFNLSPVKNSFESYICKSVWNIEKVKWKYICSRLIIFMAFKFICWNESVFLVMSILSLQFSFSDWKLVRIATGLSYSATLIRCSLVLVISSNCNPTRELMITSLKYPEAAHKQMCPLKLEITKVIRRNKRTLTVRRLDALDWFVSYYL